MILNLFLIVFLKIFPTKKRITISIIIAKVLKCIEFKALIVAL
jgi:hypothetical protein